MTAQAQIRREVVFTTLSRAPRTASELSAETRKDAHPLDGDHLYPWEVYRDLMYLHREGRVRRFAVNKRVVWWWREVER